MSVVVVGSVAFDSIKTPTGSAQETLGGSAVHFSLAAALFGPVRLVGVVGSDFPTEHRDLLSSSGVDLEGLETVEGGETFRWSGEYHQDMDHRDTLSVELNVFEEFQPKIPESYSKDNFLFLGNGSPVTQSSVLDQMKSSPLVVVDTMDLWIQTARGELESLLKRVEILVLNDQEAFLLSDERNVVSAGRAIQKLGPRFVVIKQGQHGALISHGGGEVSLPALPLAEVIDPTGAGDSFAGGMLGALSGSGGVDLAALKVAVAWGTVTASFCCEGFGVAGILAADRELLQERFDKYRKMIDLGTSTIPQLAP